MHGVPIRDVQEVVSSKGKVPTPAAPSGNTGLSILICDLMHRACRHVSL